jgi:hypothetical protein
VALARMGEQAPAYIYLAFVFAYGTQIIHQDRDFLLICLICAGIVSLFTIPFAGHLSDRIGRKRMLILVDSEICSKETPRFRRIVDRPRTLFSSSIYSAFPCQVLPVP